MEKIKHKVKKYIADYEVINKRTGNVSKREHVIIPDCVNKNSILNYIKRLEWETDKCLLVKSALVKTKYFVYEMPETLFIEHALLINEISGDTIVTYSI